MLNTREIATLIWFAVALVAALWNPSIRRSILGAAKAFCHPHVLATMALMVLYILGIVGILYVVTFWNLALLKDTIVWFLLGALPLFFSFMSSDNEDRVFHKIFVETLGATIFVEYIISTYTFSLPVEILLLPFATFLVLMSMVASWDKKNAPVAKLMNGLQILIGLAILAFSISAAMSDYTNIATIDAARSFLLTPLLSIMFAPFVYAVVLYKNYNSLFIQLKIGPQKEKDVVSYAKRRLLVHLRFNLHDIHTFLRAHAFELTRIKTKGDVDKMVEGRDS